MATAEIMNDLARRFGTGAAQGECESTGGEMQFPDGSGSFFCTNWAHQVRKALGVARVQIFGFHAEDNPGAEVAVDGHDFAVVDGRFIVDGWAFDWEQSAKKSVFDLADPADSAEIVRLYGDRSKWVLDTSVRTCTENEECENGHTPTKGIDVMKQDAHRNRETPWTHTAVTTKELDIEFGPTGGPTYQVTVPAGTACRLLEGGGGSSTWVVSDLGFIEDKRSFLYHDASNYGIPVQEADLVSIKPVNSNEHALEYRYCLNLAGVEWMTGDETSLHVTFNNLTGRNFSEKSVADYRDYMAWMESHFETSLVGEITMRSPYGKELRTGTVGEALTQAADEIFLALGGRQGVDVSTGDATALLEALSAQDRSRIAKAGAYMRDDAARTLAAQEAIIGVLVDKKMLVPQPGGFALRVPVPSPAPVAPTEARAARSGADSSTPSP